MICPPSMLIRFFLVSASVVSATLSLIAPNATSTVFVGSPFFITWTSVNSTGPISILLLSGDGSHNTVATVAESVEDVGEFSWTPASDFGGRQFIVEIGTGASTDLSEPLYSSQFDVSAAADSPTESAIYSAVTTSSSASSTSTPGPVDSVEIESTTGSYAWYMASMSTASDATLAASGASTRTQVSVTATGLVVTASVALRSGDLSTRSVITTPTKSITTTSTADTSATTVKTVATTSAIPASTISTTSVGLSSPLSTKAVLPSASSTSAPSSVLSSDAVAIEGISRASFLLLASVFGLLAIY